MRWGVFAIVLVSLFLVQTAFAPQWLSLLAALAFTVAWVAPAPEAALAGWLIGLAQDIGSSGPLGLHAAAYGLAVFLLTRLREVVNRNAWWVRWLATLLVAAPAQYLIALHQAYWQGARFGGASAWGAPLALAALAALLGALAVAVPTWFDRRRYRTRW